MSVSDDYSKYVKDKNNLFLFSDKNMLLPMVHGTSMRNTLDSHEEYSSEDHHRHVIIIIIINNITNQNENWNYAFFIQLLSMFFLSMIIAIANRIAIFPRNFFSAEINIIDYLVGLMCSIYIYIYIFLLYYTYIVQTLCSFRGSEKSMNGISVE